MSKVSIAIATNRPQFWIQFCGSASRNSVDLEVILVGPVANHIMRLPTKTRYIDTDAGVAKCWEIGARRATGDLLCLAADDCVFTPGFFDDVVKSLDRMGSKFDMFSAHYYYASAEFNISGMKMFNHDHMPVLPVGGVTLTESFKEIGGIDKRFDGVCWDTDLYMRFIEAGGKTIVLDQHRCHETLAEGTLYNRNQVHDRQIIRDMWFTGDQPKTTRNSKVESYTDAELIATEVTPTIS